MAGRLLLSYLAALLVVSRCPQVALGQQSKFHSDLCVHNSISVSAVKLVALYKPFWQNAVANILLCIKKLEEGFFLNYFET